MSTSSHDTATRLSAKLSGSTYLLYTVSTAAERYGAVTETPSDEAANSLLLMPATRSTCASSIA